MRKTLKIGLEPPEAIARYTRDIVAVRRQRAADDPDIWVPVGRELREAPVGAKPGSARAQRGTTPDRMTTSSSA